MNTQKQKTFKIITKNHSSDQFLTLCVLSSSLFSCFAKSNTLNFALISLSFVP